MLIRFRRFLSSRLKAAYRVDVLPEPVGTGRQDDAVAGMNHLVKIVHHLFRHSQLGKTEYAALPIQNPHDQLFPVHRVGGGHAEIHFARLGADPEPSVLRLAALGNVDLRQRLQRRRHAKSIGLFKLHPLLQHAVDPKPHAVAVLQRLQMHVTGSLDHRRLQHFPRRLDSGHFRLVFSDLNRVAIDIQKLQVEALLFPMTRRRDLGAPPEQSAFLGSLFGAQASHSSRQRWRLGLGPQAAPA